MSRLAERQREARQASVVGMVCAALALVLAFTTAWVAQAAIDAGRSIQERRRWGGIVRALVPLALVFLGACTTAADLHEPVHKIAEDFKVYRASVEPASTLSPTDAQASNDLGGKLDANLQRLDEATR